MKSRYKDMHGVMVNCNVIVNC
uniref:Uncharacterized protein n=1 Tax=Arundo donax TaxID=35708 RepID=A0A0A8ZDL8_ARUDO